MTVSKISVSLSPEAMDLIEKRSLAGERSAQISRGLERYAAILQGKRQELAELLSDEEIGLIVDVFNGTAFWDTISVRLAWASVQDGIEMEALDKKWKVADGADLVRRVKALDYAATVALVDAVEVWWNRIASGEQPQPQPTISEVFEN